MESIVYEDSPLADYLEGRGEAPTLDAEVDFATPSSAPTADSSSFAPTGVSGAYAKYRKRIPSALKLHARSTSRSLSRIHHACAGAVRGHLAQSENAAFLERFRYTIIASDLLNEHRQGFAQKEEGNGATRSATDQGTRPAFSTNGVYGISFAAFVLSASIAWARNVSGPSTFAQLTLLVALSSIIALAAQSFIRRKWLQHTRAQAADSVASLLQNAQAFDTALLAALTIIQEVELVARGYRISAPLPPVSRMDDQVQQRRCARLRKTARAATNELLQPVAKAASSLERQTVPTDLERYHDIYEISRTDIQDVEQLAIVGQSSDEDAESLKSLKLGLQQLFLSRKVLLCDLLALDADGTRADFQRWALVAQTLQNLTILYNNAAVSLDALLSDEDRFAVPTTPKLPLSPSRDRARAQIRKLGALSSGIRGLQAKMHILREEADSMLGGSEDSSDLGVNLLTQYDAIGADLKALLQEWEEGRAALTLSQNKRRSLSSAGLLSPRAETPTSWSGTTAIGGSPAEALRALNGEAPSPRLDPTSSDEEIFEAIAAPRQRSTLSREERIAKMKDDREQREKARESRQASTNMLRELETVLKHKPQSSKSSRRVTVM